MSRYALTMKTTVSIPDDVFQVAEHLARSTRKSRRQLYSEALEEYVLRHAPETITEAMERAVEPAGRKPDEFVSSAAHQRLSQSEW